MLQCVLCIVKCLSHNKNPFTLTACCILVGECVVDMNPSLAHAAGVTLGAVPSGAR